MQQNDTLVPTATSRRRCPPPDADAWSREHVCAHMAWSECVDAGQVARAIKPVAEAALRRLDGSDTRTVLVRPFTCILCTSCVIIVVTRYTLLYGFATGSHRPWLPPPTSVKRRRLGDRSQNLPHPSETLAVGNPWLGLTLDRPSVWHECIECLTDS